MLWSPPTKATVFSREANLYSLGMRGHSKTSPGSTRRLAALLARLYPYIEKKEARSSSSNRLLLYLAYFNSICSGLVSPAEPKSALVMLCVFWEYVCHRKMDFLRNTCIVAGVSFANRKGS